MLLNVRQVSMALGIDWKDVYYLVAVSDLNAVKIRGSLRFFSEDVEDFCVERESEARNRGTVSRYYDYGRCRAVLRNIGKDDIPADAGRNAEGLEGRRRDMVFCPKRFNRVSGRDVHDMNQLFFDFDEAV